MNGMLSDEAVMEEANDILDFEEEYALEADDMIDTMVDGEEDDDDEFDDEDFEDDFDDEDDDDEDEDEEKECKGGKCKKEDEADEGCGSKSACEKKSGCKGKAACEADALVGDDYIKSLNLDNDDPITTSNGSIGDKNGAANFKDNYSDGAEDDNDPIETLLGSIGDKNATASFSGNYSDASLDKDDPTDTPWGSIGDKGASPKDPAVESALFFGEILGEEVAMEGVIAKLKSKVGERADKKRAEVLKEFGLKDIQSDKLNALLSEKKYDSALKITENYGKNLEKVLAGIKDDDPDAKSKRKKINRLIKTNSCLIIGIQYDKTVKKYTDQGMSVKEAGKKAQKELYSNAKKVKDPATESYIMDCLNMLHAFEAAVNSGSIGDGNASADFDTNFSDGIEDNDDPIETPCGSIGDDGTAKDPSSAEESSLLDELDSINDSLFEDI